MVEKFFWGAVICEVAAPFSRYIQLFAEFLIVFKKRDPDSLLCRQYGAEHAGSTASCNDDMFLICHIHLSFHGEGLYQALPYFEKPLLTGSLYT